MAGTTSNYAYMYDAMGRLLTMTKDGTLVEEYQYGPNGARTSEINIPKGITTPKTYAYSDEDHLLTAGDIAYQYDADGFLVTKTKGAEVTEYAYSSRGELLQVQFPDGKVIEYIHDPYGRRIAKKVNGAITEKYLWGRLTSLLAVYDGSNNLLIRFEYADQRMPVAIIKGSTIYYLTNDQLGTLKVVSDAFGSIVKKVEYDSFGEILNDSNPTFEIPFGFAGGLYDRDTGLVHFVFRDYDPDIGRWTAKDPIWFAGGDTDLYGYVGNNPVNWVDPYGLFVFGHRPLSGLPWIPLYSSNPIGDYFNTELSHEHGFFEDGTGDNIGFGPHGRFYEDPTGKSYRYDNKHYDDDLMREALKNVRDGEYSNLPWKKNNCQDWADRLRKEYERLKREKDKSECK